MQKKESTFESTGSFRGPMVLVNWEKFDKARVCERWEVIIANELEKHLGT